MTSRISQTPDQPLTQGPLPIPSKPLTLQSLKQRTDDRQREFAGDSQISPQLENIQTHLAALEKRSDYVSAHPELLDTLDAHLKMLSQDNPHNNSILHICITILSAALTDPIATKIAHGQAKEVFILGDRSRARHVYSVPRETSGVLGKIEYVRHKSELVEELKTARDIREKVPEAIRHLAIDAEEVTRPEERVQGKFTLRSAKAEGDLGKVLAKKPSKLRNPWTAMHGLFQGVADLHQAGYTHGDMKLDNVFMYGDGTLKLADLGKAKKQSPIEDSFYTGNPRHEPPEGRQSQASDVYGLGEMVVETFGSLAPEGPPALPEVPEKDRKKVTVGEGRSGFERYLIEHKDCTQTETTTLRGKFSTIGRRISSSVTSPSADQLKKADEAVGDYIDKLILKLKELPEYGSDEAKAALDQMGQLMKDMMRADRSQRIPIKEALERYQQILPALEHITPSPQATPSPGPS